MARARMFQATCDAPQNQAGRDAPRIMAFLQWVVQAPQALGQLVVWRAPPASRWGTRARTDNTPQAGHSSTRQEPGVGAEQKVAPAQWGPSGQKQAVYMGLDRDTPEQDTSTIPHRRPTTSQTDTRVAHGTNVHYAR